MLFVLLFHVKWLQGRTLAADEVTSRCCARVQICWSSAAHYSLRVFSLDLFLIFLYPFHSFTSFRSIVLKTVALYSSLPDTERLCISFNIHWFQTQTHCDSNKKLYTKSIHCNLSLCFTNFNIRPAINVLQLISSRYVIFTQCAESVHSAVISSVSGFISGITARSSLPVAVGWQTPLTSIQHNWNRTLHTSLKFHHKHKNVCKIS